MNKKCLCCGDSFSGRSDKKFCTDYCRNMYNNKKNTLAPFVRDVNKILKKNYLILSKLINEGKNEVNKTGLYSKGFNFDFHTNTCTTKSGKEFIFCYDKGYIFIDDETLNIVEKDDIV